MAATLATFQAGFPEFASGDPVLIQAKLNEASRQIDLVGAGALADDFVYLLTAQKLAKLPSGNTSKLVNKDGSTVYDDDLARIRRDVSSGLGIT